MNDHEYLYALMHGELHGKKSMGDQAYKSKSEIELDKKIEAYVDEMAIEEDPDHKQLQDPKLKREKIKSEMKESLKLIEATLQMEKAVGILISEGLCYLSKEESEQLISDLFNAEQNFESMRGKETEDPNLQALTKISGGSMDAIAKMALAKFEEDRFGDSTALFYLLSFLNPNYFEYWFRLGIAAQKDGDIELALKAYAAALAIDSNNVEARIFSAECFFKKNHLSEAKSEIAALKEIVKNGEVDKMWVDLLSGIEALIKQEESRSSDKPKPTT